MLCLWYSCRSVAHCKRRICESTIAHAAAHTHRNTHHIRTAHGVCVKQALPSYFAACRCCSEVLLFKRILHAVHHVAKSDRRLCFRFRRESSSAFSSVSASEQSYSNSGISLVPSEKIVSILEEAGFPVSNDLSRNDLILLTSNILGTSATPPEDDT